MLETSLKLYLDSDGGSGSLLWSALMEVSARLNRPCAVSFELMLADSF